MLGLSGQKKAQPESGTDSGPQPYGERELVTKVPTSRKLPSIAQDPSRARAGILSELAGKRLWMAIAGFLLLTNLVTPIILVQTLIKPQLVVALDGANTFHVGPGQDYAASDEITTTHGVLGSLALLQRSEVGFDLPEMMERLYTRLANQKAKDQLQGEMEGMKERKERWRPEVSSVELVRVDDDRLYVIRAQGQLIKSGVAAGGRYETAQEYTLLLRLIRNPDILRNGRYPLVVYDYELSFSGDARNQTPGTPTDGASAVEMILQRQIDQQQQQGK